MDYRTEKDSLGKVSVPADRKWGAQTQRSLENFPIGTEKMPGSVIRAYALLKKAAAQTNAELGKMDGDKAERISRAVDEILDGQWPDEFPLSVWQTGSGTQTNMNVNEVISRLANRQADGDSIHPNDDVNLGQSSNDTFPTVMHLAALMILKEKLLPALEEMRKTLVSLMEENEGVIKVGRTHLQDATPILFSQEISGWLGMVEQNTQMIKDTQSYLHSLSLGGTAVGTGLNTHPEFASKTIGKLADWSGFPLVSSTNKFHGLSSKDAFVHAHGALKALAANALKMANDVRWLASGPRSGIGEITIPANEPGSSIMPGKVNPTQAEALTMVCVQVMGNDTTIGIAASQGNFELNVYMPVIIHNFTQSVQLLADGLDSFNERCLTGIHANEKVMEEHLTHSLMLVTALTPHIGYDKASEVAKKAHEQNKTLKEVAVTSGFMTADEFDKRIDPGKMV